MTGAITTQKSMQPRNIKRQRVTVHKILHRKRLIKIEQHNFQLR